MTRRFWAFTLAETLIVMGIIGVVAALTVPNLNASTGEKEKVAKVKKIYKDLNDAYGRAVAVYGPVDEWFAKDTTYAAQSTRFGERMLDFMKVSKNCKTATGCFYNGSILYTNSTFGGGNYDTNASRYKVITTDGMSVDMVITDKTFTYNSASSCPGPYCHRGAYITVDIDGPIKGAHTWGKDMFEFCVDKDYGIIPTGGMTDNTADTSANLTANCMKTGDYCTGWVIENANMDYLKANNGTCPNGIVLSWTNTTCK